MTADFETTLAALLAAARAAEPDRPFVTFEAAGEGTFGPAITLSQMAARAQALAAALARVGIRRGQTVATLLDNDPDYIAAILALARLGAVWVPLDRRAPPPMLTPRLALTQPHAALAQGEHAARLCAAGFTRPILDPADIGAAGPDDDEAVEQAAPGAGGPDDRRAILFTSGTTGRPKGVIVTERMFCAAGRFAALAGRADPRQTFLLWEPLNHIGGAQMIPAALLSGARLAMVAGFSASRFWTQAKAAGATRLHYLGGVLDLLAKQPATAAERDHVVTLGFGAAARPEMWRIFPERFGVELVEVYGQTEAASFCIMNREGIPGSIGRPLPHFQVALLDAQGQVVAAKGTGEGTGEAVGEIALRADPPGLLTPGYLDDPQATAAAFRHGWFLTGDLARRDAAGHLIFAGRAKEAIRRRGENVSALEIETVIAAYLAIEECAVLGVPAEIGEEEILAVVTLRPGQTLRPEALLDWLSERLAPHQKPRYLRIVATLPRTPSERIAKAEISRDIRADWDAEAK